MQQDKPSNGMLDTHKSNLAIFSMHLVFFFCHLSFFTSSSPTYNTSSTHTLSLFSFFYSNLSSYLPVHAHHFLPAPPYPHTLEGRRQHREGFAEDRAHWQARLAVTYCLLMECDKSCGSAGCEAVRARVLSTWACLHVHMQLRCMCVFVCLHVSMPERVFVHKVLVWGRRHSQDPSQLI